MQLTRFSDLGLRVLMYLSQQDREPPVTVSEIAQQFAVPVNHLTKVVHKLSKLGWISTLRGRHGGLRLAKPAADISVGQVVRQMEGHEQLVDCDKAACVLNGCCLLQGALDAAMQAFYAKLDTYSLADVCASQTGQAIVVLHRDYLRHSADRSAVSH